MVNQLAIPASLVFYLDSKLLTKRLQDIQTADLLTIYKEEDDEDVRQAMAPELTKRQDIQTADLLTIYKEEDDEDIRQAMVPELTKRLQDVIKKGEFKVI